MREEISQKTMYLERRERRKYRILFGTSFFFLICVILFFFVFGIRAIEETESINLNNENIKIEKDYVNLNVEIDNDSRNDMVIKEIYKDKDSLPEIISNAVDDFIRSISEENDFGDSLRFKNAILYYNESKNIDEYLVIYSYKITYYRENGKRVRTLYPVKIIVEENGNILDKEGPKNKYNHLKIRGT